MSTNQSSYSLTSIGNLSFIYTNKKFGNLSHKFGDTSHYEQTKKRLLALAPENRFVIKLATEHKDSIIDLTSNKILEDDTTILGDGLIFDANLANVWLAPADCAIIVIFDKAEKIICVIHASRLTLPQNIIAKSITKYLKKISTDYSKISAFISPSIASSDYVFESNIAKTLFDNSWDKFIKPGPLNKLHVDIKARCISELKDSGIYNIVVAPQNTGNGNFFSQSQGRLNPNLIGRNGFIIFKK
jgi:copper oxidase (laccase) domain-containing protein